MPVCHSSTNNIGTTERIATGIGWLRRSEVNAELDGACSSAGCLRLGRHGGWGAPRYPPGAGRLAGACRWSAPGHCSAAGPARQRPQPHEPTVHAVVDAERQRPNSLEYTVRPANSDSGPGVW
jgi:hypothetical protein